MFRVEAELTYLFPEPAEVLLLLEAAHSSDQQVHRERLSITPPEGVTRLDDLVTGERRVVFNTDGETTIAYTAEVEVKARDVDLESEEQSAVRDLPADALRFLRASRYCPSDRFERFCRREFGELRGGARVQAILDWIDRRLAYEPGVSDATTTALDTFVGGAGVCRDFAHLAITLCRASDIPARAVSAYAYGLAPPDMHAVAEVFLGGRWRMIDATRKCDARNLIRVATGLDAADIAFMTVFGEAAMVAQRFSVEALDR